MNNYSLLDRFWTWRNSMQGRFVTWRLQRELPAAAEAFGWDSSELWITGLRAALPRLLPLNRGIVVSRMKMYDYLQPEMYGKIVKNCLEIQVRYDSMLNPTPLAVINQFWEGSLHVDLTLTVSPDKATLEYYDSSVIAVFRDCGRVPRCGNDRPVRYAAELIRQMTGIRMDFEDIFSSLYDSLVFDRVDGEWSQRVWSPTASE